MNENGKKRSAGNTSDSGKIRIIEEIVEGFWDCTNCNAKNRGSAQQCESCGAIRSENVKFYVDEDSKVIKDEAELEKAKAGPDWVCPFCSNMSPSSSTKCTGCGSDRSDGKNRATRELAAGETGKDEKKPQRSEKSAEPTKPTPTWLKFGCGLFALIFVIFIALSCHEKAAKIEITANEWVRQIERAEYKTVRENAWANEVPAGARKFSSERQVRSHKEIPDGFEEVNEEYTEKVKVGEKQVEDGKVDLGNGRFKVKYKVVPEYREEKKTRRVKRQKFRKEPIYDEMVHYDIERWIPFATIELKGTTDEPRWPDSGASNNVPPQIGDLTEKARIETYIVKAKKDGSPEEIEVKKLRGEPLTNEQFMKLRVGTKWDAIFNGLGHLLDIKFQP